ncbi:hypothetical protein DFH05DRAFT_1516687 [Lentinula detonsa]|uniref:Secreted protein n=1 Tax=Lentinula detonsa TaxID=2804962 RepID=A0A9W8NQG0_9AGAR|nr:hypothetical protein DFH05DRAFT_1516687 [Lentinula detonsa]
MSNLLSCRPFRFVILILLGLCLMAYAAPTPSFGFRSHTNVLVLLCPPWRTLTDRFPETFYSRPVDANDNGGRHEGGRTSVL